MAWVVDMAGEFVVKSEGGKRQLVINYKGAPYGADIAQYAPCMADVITKLREVDADEVVLSEYYERIYDREQTRLLKGIADLVTKFESEAVWAPSNLSSGTDSRTIAPRHDAVMQFLSLLSSDFFKAYLFILQEIKAQEAKAERGTDAEKTDLEVYLKTLEFLRGELERSEVIQKMKKYLIQLSGIPADRGIYHAFFESVIKPSFIGSRIFFSGIGSLQLADQYDVAGTKVYVYKHPEKVEYLYYINPPEYTLPPDQYFLLEKTKEVVSTHRPASVSFLDMQQARRYFKKVYTATIGDLAQRNNIKISAQEKDDLANIVARYTIGYGVLEILLSDRQITDVYIDSPLGEKPIYLVHSKYGQCQTNIIFSEDEAKSTVSRFRALSGRPFDEAHPILDFDLADLQTRIAAIGKPLAVDGTAFAFRLHKDTPWTLAQFLDQKMFTPMTAGLLSFFVDAQASSLIVGSRGAGKTSILQAMMQEIPQNLRIIVQEDSVTGDSEILVERKGKLEKTTIGRLVDSLFETYGSMKINGKEFLAVNPENISVFSVNGQNKIVLSRVSQFIRSRPDKNIYTVETRSGKRIKVTQDHSLFSLIDNKLVPVRTASLNTGERIAVADVVENSSNAQKTVQISLSFEEVGGITNLGRTGEFVYDLSVPGCENFVCENIIAHNTQELPVPQLKKLGFNIQRLKTRPPLGSQSESEVSAEDALRTALRLGDSVLIVGEVRSSVRGTEEVVVVEDGKTRRIPIQELEGKDVKRFQVPTLDFDLGVKLAPLTGFVKHPARNRLLEVTTQTGRKVTVTHDHSLFAATRDFHIAAVECKDLKVGDVLAIPASMPCGYADVEKINVFDYLPEFRVEGFQQPVRSAIRALGWRRATQAAGVKTGDVYNYFRANQKSNLSFQAFSHVMQEAGQAYALDELKAVRGTGQPIPASIQVDEDFCRFLGYYVSEGYYAAEKKGGGSVILTNSNPALLEDFHYLGQKLFGLRGKQRDVHNAGDSVQVRFGSSALTCFLSRLECGRTCTEKRVPPIVFGLPKRKIAAFLQGIYSGDGSFTASRSSGNSVRYYSTSKKLVEDVAYLLLAFGIVARIHSRLPKKGNLLWIAEFKEREMVETFLREIGFRQKQPKMMVRAWPHSKANAVYFDSQELKKHLTRYPRRYRHLFRFGRCSLNYLRRVAFDPECKASEQLKAFASGSVYLDRIACIKEILLPAPEPVYDLSVSPSQNFVGGFGGILLHNTEARALYEAMRVGAVGNVVMGTIHGESAYSIWDRVVNDLGVPTTSFKATDFAIVAAPIRFKGSLRRSRRMVEITEIKKHWGEDPDQDGGLLQWMQFDAGTDTMKMFDEEIKASEWLDKLERNRGLSREEIWAEIKARAESKQYLVDVKRKYGIPKLLEAENSIKAHTQYMLLEEAQREESGSVDHKRLMQEWKQWVDDALAKPLMKA